MKLLNMKKILFLTAACLVLLGAAIACKGLAGFREGPCDIYRKGGTPCVTAHSTTRLLYSKYRGPLYQVVRESDGASLDIYARKDGIAAAAAQDAFCKGTVCYISVIYDQSGMGIPGPDRPCIHLEGHAPGGPALLRHRHADARAEAVDGPGQVERHGLV